MVGSPIRRARKEAAKRAEGLAPVAFVDGAQPGAEPPPARNLMSAEEYQADKRKPHVAYSDDLALEVVTAIACGMGIIEMCSMPGMPSRRTIYQWRRDQPKFAEMLDDALKFRADQRLIFIDSLINEVTSGRVDAIAGRVVFDMHKWLAGKENFKYSDTQKVELSGPNGTPLSLLDMGDSGRMELARWASFVLRLGQDAEERVAAIERPALELMAEGGKNG